MFKLRQLIKLASVGQRSLIRNYGNNLLNDRTTFAHRSSNALFSQFDTSKQLTNQCSTFSTVIPQSQQLEERDELAAFAEKNRIKVIGQNAPSPVLDLQQFEWPDSVQRFLNRLQITQPTPIQSAAWPIALSGRDLIGVSATGSGKTLAFLLPAVLRLSSITDSKSPLALVLTPTRELAVQIESVAKQLPSFRTLCCYGGASRDRQKMSLERYNPKLVIATPGRLNDLISDGSVDLSNVEYLVLDEADRMLDMGFEPQIRSIVEKIPKQRQTLMWR